MNATLLRRRAPVRLTELQIHAMNRDDALAYMSEPRTLNDLCDHLGISYDSAEGITRRLCRDGLVHSVGLRATPGRCGARPKLWLRTERT